MILNSDEAYLLMMLNAENADDADDVANVYDIMESVLEGANQGGVCFNPSNFLSRS